MGKVLALIVLVVAMLGLAINIERSARPVSDKAGALAGEAGHDDH